MIFTKRSSCDHLPRSMFHFDYLKGSIGPLDCRSLDVSPEPANSTACSARASERPLDESDFLHIFRQSSESVVAVWMLT